MFYVDNIRTYLTVLVVLHHVAVAYGGMGGWPIKETPTDAISPILFLLFNALNQSYFMSFFFLLAGYFTPRSLDRKGSASFIKGRLTRLGIPIMFYVLVLGQLTSWVVANLANNLGIPFSEIWRQSFSNISLRNISFGHLWFLFALLIFAAMYVVYRSVSSRNSPGAAFVAFGDGFPPNRIIALSILLLSTVTFLVRLWFPVDYWVYGFQFAHMSRYLLSFFAGILAYRGGWFGHLPRVQARLWGKIALINTVLLPVIFVLGVSGPNGVDAFLGGMTVQSMALSAWETVSFFSIVIWLLDLFRHRFNVQNRVLRWMAPNVFAAYILHQIVVVIIQIPFLGLAWPTPLKFVLVSLISVPVVFLLSSLLRKIPYVDKVL